MSERICSAFETHLAPIEVVSAISVQGRVSAEEVVSNVNIPGNKISAMDGYAVRSSDLRSASAANPRRFKVERRKFPGNTSLAGNHWATCYVATGAPVPLRFDTVVRVEDTRLEKDSIVITRAIPSGANVALKGEDVKVGERLIQKGRILNSSDISMLIGIGRKKIAVFKSPVVGILSVGDELKEFGDLTKNKTVNNYSNLISGYLADHGAHPVSLGIAKDNEKEIASKVRAGCKRCDMVITIAGSSVGAKDYTPNAVLAQEHSRMLFHGVRMVPIRPAGLAMVEAKPVVIVPGHSVSAALTFFVLVLPVLNLITGLGFGSRRVVLDARAVEPFSNERSIEALILTSVKKKGSHYEASPLPWGSNLISSLTKSNGFVRLDPHQSISGMVTVQLFGSHELNRIDAL
ncbi:MAG: molybdopterin molybdotransferase MoeA [Nitrososphaerales archaeon]